MYHKKKQFMRIKSAGLYVFWGALASLLNIGAFYFCVHWICLSGVLSNICAWIIALVFAFLTNKYFVFHKRESEKGILGEFIEFTLGRIFTGALETIFIYYFIDVLSGPQLLGKIILSIITAILNYVISKAVVFNTP